MVMPLRVDLDCVRIVGRGTRVIDVLGSTSAVVIGCAGVAEDTAGATTGPGSAAEVSDNRFSPTPFWVS